MSKKEVDRVWVLITREPLIRFFLSESWNDWRKVLVWLIELWIFWKFWWAAGFFLIKSLILEIISLMKYVFSWVTQSLCVLKSLNSSLALDKTQPPKYCENTYLSMYFLEKSSPGAHQNFQKIQSSINQMKSLLQSFQRLNDKNRLRGSQITRAQTWSIFFWTRCLI